MNDRDFRLHQFFAGYFNQDWDMAGATSWRDVVDEYLAQNPVTRAATLRDDLRWWLKEGETDRLPDVFGCEYDPRSEGMDQSTWVRALADFLDSRLAR